MSRRFDDVFDEIRHVAGDDFGVGLAGEKFEVAQGGGDSPDWSGVEVLLDWIVREPQIVVSVKQR